MKSQLCAALMAGLATIMPVSGTLALAKEPSFVGTWAAHRAMCTIPQSRSGAPMLLRLDGYDQHETHCTFGNVHKASGGWMVNAVCTVDGDSQKHGIKFSVRHDRLSIREGGHARLLVRC